MGGPIASTICWSDLPCDDSRRMRLVAKKRPIAADAGVDRGLHVVEDAARVGDDLRGEPELHDLREVALRLGRRRRAW